MLYPDFDDLVAYKNLKIDLTPTSRRAVKSTVSGNHRSPFRGQGLEFDSVREYVPGDDIRNIDWRVTARMGSPHLKIFKEERERNINICVDLNATMRFGTRNTFKSVQAAHVAALLGWQTIAHHDRVSACLFGDVPKGILSFPPQRTRKSFFTILKSLSQPSEEQHQIAIKDALQHICESTHNGAMVYLISDFMEINPEFHNETSIRLINKKCNVVFIAINDPADMSLVPAGRMGFCANLMEKVFVDTGNRSGREAYAAQWKENRQRLYEASARLKVPLLELTTQSNIQRDLALGLKNIARGKKR